ncbi:hypothetical protein RND81_08G042000 [Saponaria officinalis]|uniref:Uncharacterized protein n=1 Tax=Saponaria officinalis TaxID=3572 RepID=A0AAW1J3A2_SAPOF
MRTKLTFDLSHLHIVQKSGHFTADPPQPPHYHHAPPPSTAAVTGWKSPVPYLFGGLAAMMGLIAFALLILACSYLKLSGNFDSGENSGEDGGDEKVKEADKAVTVVANSILVIMAGEEKPTFLAMPTISSRPTSFGGGGGDGIPTCSCSCSVSNPEFKTDGL